MNKREVLLAIGLGLLITLTFLAGLDFVGALGAIFAFSLFVPQAGRAWKLRDDYQAMNGLSFVGYLLLLANSVVWIIYALGTSAMWVIVANVPNIPLSIFLMMLILRSRNREHEG